MHPIKFWWVQALATKAYQGLSNLRHQNGQKVCVLYSDEVKNSGVVTFNIREMAEHSGDDEWVACSTVESILDLRGIAVRSGCFCNPGACAAALQLTPQVSQPPCVKNQK